MMPDNLSSRARIQQDSPAPPISGAPQADSSTATARGAQRSPFARTLLFAGRIDGISASHLTALHENLPPKPTYGRRSTADAGYMPPQADLTPKPEDAAAPPLAMGAAYESETDEDLSNDDDDADPSLEATDNVNPELAHLANKRSPYKASDKAMRWLRAAGADSNHRAYLASLEAIKSAPRRRSRSTQRQRNVYAAIKLHNPLTDHEPARQLRISIPKPLLRTTKVSPLIARNDLTSPAAAKQDRNTSEAKGILASQTLAWMQENYVKALAPTDPLDRLWHFSCTISKDIMKSNYPAPGYG